MCASILQQASILSCLALASQNEGTELFIPTYGQVYPYLFLLLMSRGVQRLDQAVCWGQHARNSQFSLKILPLCTIASNIKSIYGPLYNVLVWFLFSIIL